MNHFKRSVSIISIILICFLITLLPKSSKCEEWTYKGINTTNIPGFSVYPSEYYYYSYPDDPMFAGIYNAFEIIKGNITDKYEFFAIPTIPMGANGTAIWVQQYSVNATTGEKTKDHVPLDDIQLAYWNESIGYAAYNPMIIPVENDGYVSEKTLLNATKVWETVGFFYIGIEFEHFATNINQYSCSYWNSSYNNAHFISNYTEDGILLKIEAYGFSMPNVTLHSQPAQLAPLFNLNTPFNEYLSPEVNFTLTVVDADNNNDGTIDDDYLYRIYYNNTWSDWATIPTIIDLDLGEVPAGNYTVLTEVKNMYGITQEEIDINYNPPEENGPNGEIPAIPGYNLFLIIGVISIISTLIIRKRLKS